MGKKGESKQLKRYPAPRFWPIHVKEAKWTVKPSAGPHLGEACFPLALIIRDMMGYAKTANEARIVISEGKVKVDGKIRRDYRHPVGLMDVVEIPELDKAYRILPVLGRGLSLIEIPKEEASYKLCRIEGKTTVKSGHIQLNLHDGGAMLLKADKSSKPVENIYKVRDTLKIGLPNQDIMAHLKFEEGSYILVVSGANQGKIGKVKNLVKGTATRPPLVSIVTVEEEILQTTSDYAFTIGREKPELTLPIQLKA